MHTVIRVAAHERTHFKRNSSKYWKIQKSIWESCFFVPLQHSKEEIALRGYVGSPSAIALTKCCPKIIWNAHRVGLDLGLHKRQKMPYRRPNGLPFAPMQFNRCICHHTIRHTVSLHRNSVNCHMMTSASHQGVEGR